MTSLPAARSNRTRRGHPHYVLIENANRDWCEKVQAAREVMAGWLAAASR
jgi:hypothetical protein